MLETVDAWALGQRVDVLEPDDVGSADGRDRSGAPDDGRQGTATARTYAWLALAVAVMVAFVVPIVVRRPMDGDEGYYSIATKLVAQGNAPYADFWFQQAPLLLYVYGAVDRVLGSSWFVLRGTSALLTVVLGGAIAAHGLRRWRSPGFAFLAVTLFVTTPMAFQWFPTVKTYALSTLLLFGAYLAADASSRRSWVAAGVLLGLAIDTRLLFATTIIVFALYAGRHLLAFAAGLLAGLVPLLLFFLTGPARFINDAISSQTMRSDETLAVTQKINTVAGVLADPHFLVLSLATFGLLIASLYAHRRVPFVVAIALALGVTNVIPTPSYQQYFVTLVPFLVVATVDLLVLVTGRNPSSSKVAGIALLAIVLGALVPLAKAPALGVIPVSSGTKTPYRLDLRATRAVSAAIDARARAGETVLAFWPGFLYESHARPVPGVESDWEVEALRVTGLSPERAHEYHMLSADEIVDAIKSHQTRLIVLGTGALSDDRPWRQIIETAGYRPVERLGLVTLYEYGATGESGG